MVAGGIIPATRKKGSITWFTLLGCVFTSASGLPLLGLTPKQLINPYDSHIGLLSPIGLDSLPCCLVN